MSNNLFLVIYVIVIISVVLNFCTSNIIITVATQEKNMTLLEFKEGSEATKNNLVSLVNCYRSCHSVSPLTRSSQVESQSNSWAQHLGSSGNFQHSSSNYGENLYGGPVSNSGQDPVSSWYFECSGHYTYNGENNPLSCGHFTQLVWKSSREIGIGIAPSGNFGYIVVANFNPPGNYLGTYSQNVPVPDSSCVQSCKSGSGSGGSTSSSFTPTDSSSGTGMGTGSGDNMNGNGGDSNTGNGGGIFNGNGSGSNTGNGGGIFNGNGSGSNTGNGDNMNGDGGGIFNGNGGIFNGNGGGSNTGNGDNVNGNGGGIFNGNGGGSNTGNGGEIFNGNGGGSNINNGSGDLYYPMNDTNSNYGNGNGNNGGQTGGSHW